MSVRLESSEWTGGHRCSVCGEVWAGHHACGGMQTFDEAIVLPKGVRITHDRPSGEVAELREAVGWLAGALMILAAKVYGPEYDDDATAVRFRSRIREYKKLAGYPGKHDGDKAMEDWVESGRMEGATE